MLQVGDIVGEKYKIIKKIARGGMSTVWLANHEKLNMTVAIKEFQRTGMKSTREALRREINVLKNLAHPGLPMILDLIDTYDMLLLVMTYVEGESLERLLKRQGAQSQEHVINWGKQLCDILGYLHSRTPPIIYTDIKPANIILRSDGQLVLIDFGTALKYKLDEPLGLTVIYAAPELHNMGKQIDVRADIYSLGVTLYQLVTGETPTESHVCKHIRQSNPALSVVLEQVIETCTQRDPDQRFQSVNELKYALDTLYLKDNSLIVRRIRTFWNSRKIKKMASCTECGRDTSISHVTEDPDMIRYNAEQLSYVQSDMENTEL